MTQRIEKANSQRLRYVEHVPLGDHKMRVCIESDSYDFQSKANISRWDGERWQLVASISGPAMSTPTALAYRRNTSSRDFAHDRKELMQLAKEVLI